VSSSWFRRKIAHWQFSGIGGLREDVEQRVAVLHRDDRYSAASAEVVGHVHSSPSPKYWRTSSGHCGFREQHLPPWLASSAARICLITRASREVLVVGALALDQVGDRIEAKPSTPMSSH